MPCGGVVGGLDLWGAAEVSIEPILTWLVLQCPPPPLRWLSIVRTPDFKRCMSGRAFQLALVLVYAGVPDVVSADV